MLWRDFHGDLQRILGFRLKIWCLVEFFTHVVTFPAKGSNVTAGNAQLPRSYPLKTPPFPLKRIYFREKLLTNKIIILCP